MVFTIVSSSSSNSDRSTMCFSADGASGFGNGSFSCGAEDSGFNACARTDADQSRHMLQLLWKRLPANG